jgi:hypothetical protein
VPLLLRTITKSRWYREFDWVPRDEVQADALKDLGATEGALSVWEVDDQRGNLERILTALAASRESLQHMDYLLVEQDRVLELGISVEANSGDTLDADANESWHRDLTQLTARRLVDLAHVCRQHGEPGRRLQKELLAAIREGITAHHLSVNRMKPALAEKLLG